MSETIILELAQNSADSSKPGEYHVQLAQPTIINPGDQLSFRMASIDSNKTDSDTIIIAQDQPISISFSYIDVNYDSRDEKTFVSGDPVTPDYQYYACYNDMELELLNSVDIEIIGYMPPRSLPNPNPDYDVAGGSFCMPHDYTFASQIDRTCNLIMTFTYLQPDGSIASFQGTGTNYNFIESGGGTAGGFSASAPTTNYPAGTFPVTAMGSFGGGVPSGVTIRKGSLRLAGVSGSWPGIFQSRAYPDVKTFGPIGAYPPGASLQPPYLENLYDTNYPYQLNQFGLFRVNTTPVVETTGLQLNMQMLNATLPAGRYEPQSLAVKMTQLLSDANGILPVPVGGDQIYAPANPLLTRTDTDENTALAFRKIDFQTDQATVDFTDANTYVYWDASAGDSASYYIGASNVSVEYGEAGNLFQISYLHTPLNNPASPGEQDLGLYYTIESGSQNYFVVKQATGVVVHDLQPVEFWKDQLGLYTNLIVPIQYDNSGVAFYTLDSMMPRITYGFQGLDTFFIPHPGTGTPLVYPNPRKATPIPPTLNPTYFNVTGQSKAIIAESVSVNLRGGYFLIEILNLFRNQGGYIDADENRARISAIVSTQYDSNNAITGFSDSGIPYVHNGSPYIITDATVRILDPLTKKPVTTLGNNNCIWVEINKILPVAEPPKPKKKPFIKKRD